jgi:hypothetical protein
MGNYSLLDKIKNKLEFSKRNKKTLTGAPADEIVVYGASGVNNIVKEDKEKHATFTFGRFNPPTTGHQKLIDAVKKNAELHGGEHHIFASQSQDKDKNPLSYDEKVGFMKKAFPKTNIQSGQHLKTVLDAAKHLQSKGVTHATLMVGSDRVDEFHNLLSKYNKNPAEPDYDPKKHFHIPHLSVVSAGHRDPDAEGVEGMSASKMRSHAASGNFNEFKKGVPNQAHAQAMYDTLRNRMGIKEDLDYINPNLSPDGKRAYKAHRANKRRIEQLRSKKEKTISASQKEDELGRKISKKTTFNPKPTQGLPAGMTQNPYEETKYNIPMDRDQMAPGSKPVDIGMDKDLESSDTNKQLKRRKAMKRFKQLVDEGIDGDVAYADKPSAFGQVNTPAVSMPVPRVKQRIKNINTKPVSEGKTGLWANIHAKRERIRKGSGERMRKPGSKGAPTAADFRSAQEEVEYIEERGADSKGHFRSTESGAGLTKKGVAHFRRQNPGSKLQTAVTEKNPKGKRAARRKSFCARMGGMPGPMKDEKGRPTRKAMSLRRWRC